jgi:hypothetical protein
MIYKAFITLRDSIDIVKDYNIIVRGFVCLWDFKDTMCRIAMVFKVVYLGIHGQYVNL